MNRGERRHRTYSKWISKIKKLYNANVFIHNVWNVKENKPEIVCHKGEIETYDKYKVDKTAILYKNTRTIRQLKREKKYDDKEYRKIKINNRKIYYDEF